MKLRIKDLRKSFGWTQEHLGDLIGASKSHVSEMETGKKNPSGPMMEKIAQVFKTSVPALYDTQDDPTVATLFDIYQRLDENDRRALMAMASGLASQEKP